MQHFHPLQHVLQRGPFFDFAKAVHDFIEIFATNSAARRWDATECSSQSLQLCSFSPTQTLGACRTFDRKSFPFFHGRTQ